MENQMLPEVREALIAYFESLSIEELDNVIAYLEAVSAEIDPPKVA